MRVDIEPLIEHAHRMEAAITRRSKSAASSATHNLLVSFPDPTWAETAPGCTIWYNGEQELAQAIEALRYVALTWLRALIDPSRDWEPSAEWPEPENLIQATRELAKFAPSECVNLEEDASHPVVV